MVSVTSCSLYEPHTSQRDTLSLIAVFMSGKSRTSQTLFLHFSTPKWELQIVFAVSHLRLCGTRIQLSLYRVPPLVAISSSLVAWPFFLMATLLKSHLKSKMAGCMGVLSFLTELLKFCFRTTQQGKFASFCTVNLQRTYLKHLFC